MQFKNRKRKDLKKVTLNKGLLPNLFLILSQFKVINQLLSPWVQATTTKYKQQLRNIQWKILKGHEWYACSLNKKWHIVVNLGQFENGAAPQTACKVHVFGVSKQQKRSSKWASHADTVHDKCLKKVLILVIVPNTFLWCIYGQKSRRKFCRFFVLTNDCGSHLMLTLLLSRAIHISLWASTLFNVMHYFFLTSLSSRIYIFHFSY